jgi:hypothetical protein
MSQINPLSSLTSSSAVSSDYRTLLDALKSSTPATTAQRTKPQAVSLQSQLQQTQEQRRALDEKYVNGEVSMPKYMEQSAKLAQREAAIRHLIDQQRNR